MKSCTALWLALKSGPVVSSDDQHKENKDTVLSCKIEILDKFRMGMSNLEVVKMGIVKMVTQTLDVEVRKRDRETVS